MIQNRKSKKGELKMYRRITQTPEKVFYNKEGRAMAALQNI